MSEQQELVKRKAKLELDINDMQSEMDGDQTAKVPLHNFGDMLKFLNVLSMYLGYIMLCLYDTLKLCGW